jgi:nucleotide-binding universal stress UspA family protein
MNTTVLVGTDGTPRAQIAVDRAAALAASTQASLIVLSVVQAPAITTPMGPRGIDAVTAVHRQCRHDAEQALHVRALAAEALGVHTTSLVRTGDPAQQIIAVADEMHAATIVVGDRGLDPAGHYVLDSIPAAIAMRAKQHDVLVVRTGSGEAPPPTSPDSRRPTA